MIASGVGPRGLATAFIAEAARRHVMSEKRILINVAVVVLLLLLLLLLSVMMPCSHLNGRHNGGIYIPVPFHLHGFRLRSGNSSARPDRDSPVPNEGLDCRVKV